jgi:hypothetical protein
MNPDNAGRHGVREDPEPLTDVLQIRGLLARPQKRDEAMPRAAAGTASTNKEGGSNYSTTRLKLFPQPG